jgi:hypothetical protein
VTNFFIFVTKKEKSTQPPPMLGTFVTATIGAGSQGFNRLGANYLSWYNIVVHIADTLHSINTYIPMCGHRASYGLYRVPIVVHRRTCGLAVVVVLLPSYKNAKNLGQSA